LRIFSAEIKPVNQNNFRAKEVTVWNFARWRIAT